MPRLPRTAALVLAVLAGVAVELGIAAADARRESWDSPLYWQAGYPALIVSSGVLGWLAPADVWRIGMLAALGQVLTMMVRTDGGSLWPLGMVAAIVLGLPCVAAAWAGSRLRTRREAREAPEARK